ncbi:MAG: RDD family protein [Pirellulaceae bacterium]|nr:MAG: RDD family protein [Pirellulaceae bacterium]
MIRRVTGEVLDAAAQVVAPEHVAFRFRLAGPFQRARAYVLDLLMRAMILVAMPFLLIPLGWQGGTGLWVASLLIAGFLLDWFYGAVLETYMNGQTLGKRFCRLRVVSVDGTAITGAQAVLRNLVRAADFLPVWGIAANDWQTGWYLPLGTVGLLVMLSNRRFQRLGDLVSGTMVVYEEEQRLPVLDQSQLGEWAKYIDTIPDDFVPSHTLLRAVSAYLQKRSIMNPGRRREMAEHLAKAMARKWQLAVPEDPDAFLCAVYVRWLRQEKLATGL